MTVELIPLLIYALAVARITGMITQDAITEPLRDRLIGWLDNRPATLGSAIATLVTCPWCAGMWVSLIAAPIVWWLGDSPWLLIPALAFAFSQVTGMTSDVGR
jgi:fatty acid desaturase